MNMNDSEKAAGVLEESGFLPALSPETADVIVLNTCSIRQKAEQKFLSALGRLRRLKEERPDLKIAVMGCIAKEKGEGIFKRGCVDFVISPENIHSLREMTEGTGKGISVCENPLLASAELPALRKEKGRAWVAIMYGCENFCSYCIVPFTRGKERSRPKENVLREVMALAGKGVGEITLLGQNVNSYRGETDFPGLLKSISEVRGIERIRFVTSHPKDLSNGLIKAMAGIDKLCEHIHLPLQSGSDRILGLMNRKYTYSEYLSKIEALRESVPGVSITSDIIAGFPTESEEDHEATLRAIREIEFDGVFAFKFSPRPLTAAHRMTGRLPEDIKGRRLKEILSLEDEITLRKNKALEGKNMEILVEGKSEKSEEGTEEMFQGRTRTNKIVNFKGNDSLIGKLLQVKIKEAKRHSLLGEIIE